MLNVYEQQDANRRKSLLIILVFIGFIIAISWIFGQILGYGLDFVGMALILSGLMSFASYWWSDRIILTLSGARLADRKKDFLFYTVAENLAIAGQIPLPRLYVIENSAPNAFATGRDPKHAVVCATTGLLGKLNRTELEGVIAHEVSHIRNFDTRLMGIVTILLGMVTLLADWFIKGVRVRDRDRGESQIGAVLFLIGVILAVLSPFIAQLIQLAISRRREFFADASAVMLTRQPDGLIKALLKISADREPLEAANKATAHLYIVNPLRNRHDQVGWFANLFNTHPPIEERIKVLKEMR